MPAAHELDPHNTFERFIKGISNDVAYAAAEAAAKGSSLYNPLFIHGSSGTGKTHLLQAIAHATSERLPEAQIRYTTAEEFTNAMRTYIKQEKMNAFRLGVRKIDVLLVDDIQYLLDKRWTHGEFVHTFNALRDSGKPVILTADCPPEDLAGFEKVLRDRLQSGVVVELEPPDEGIKRTLVSRRSADCGLELPEQVVGFLASQSEAGIRALQGAVSKIVLHCLSRNEKPTIALVKQLVNFGLAKPDLHSILNVVATHFQLTPAQLREKTNSPRISEPRQIAMYLAREAGFSSVEIARQFRKDHSTVLHAVKKIKDSRNTRNALHDCWLNWRRKPAYNSHPVQRKQIARGPNSVDRRLHVTWCILEWGGRN
jgi:chromosomal replication initiator protein